MGMEAEARMNFFSVSLFLFFLLTLLLPKIVIVVKWFLAFCQERVFQKLTKCNFDCSLLLHTFLSPFSPSSPSHFGMLTSYFSWRTFHSWPLFYNFCSTNNDLTLLQIHVVSGYVGMGCSADAPAIASYAAIEQKNTNTNTKRLQCEWENLRITELICYWYHIILFSRNCL